MRELRKTITAAGLAGSAALAVFAVLQTFHSYPMAIGAPTGGDGAAARSKPTMQGRDMQAMFKVERAVEKRTRAENSKTSQGLSGNQIAGNFEPLKEEEVDEKLALLGQRSTLMDRAKSTSLTQELVAAARASKSIREHLQASFRARPDELPKTSEESMDLQFHKTRILSILASSKAADAEDYLKSFFDDRVVRAETKNWIGELRPDRSGNRQSNIDEFKGRAASFWVSAYGSDPRVYQEFASRFYALRAKLIQEGKKQSGEFYAMVDAMVGIAMQRELDPAVYKKHMDDPEEPSDLFEKTAKKHHFNIEPSDLDPNAPKSAE